MVKTILLLNQCAAMFYMHRARLRFFQYILDVQSCVQYVNLSWIFDVYNLKAESQVTYFFVRLLHKHFRPFDLEFCSLTNFYCLLAHLVKPSLLVTYVWLDFVICRYVDNQFQHNSMAIHHYTNCLETFVKTFQLVIFFQTTFQFTGGLLSAAR